jgi:hypothetical protein
MKYLLFALSQLVIIGCMQKPDPKPNYGPETVPETINQAFAEFTSDPGTIDKGEFAYMESTLQIANLPPKLSFQLGETVTNKTENSTGWVLTIVQENVMQENEKPVVSKTERRACVPKDKTKDCEVETSVMANSKANYFSQMLNFNVNKNLDSAKPLKIKDFLQTLGTEKPIKATAQRISYHNLKKEDVTFPLPNLVRLRSNCGGLARCQNLRAMSVSVDKVIWENDERGTKTTFRFIWSPDAPYFASQLLGCAQTWMDIQGQTAPVTQCEEVKDFTFGTH